MVKERLGWIMEDLNKKINPKPSLTELKIYWDDETKEIVMKD